MRFIQYFENVFGVSNPGDITWSHAVNSLEKLENTLNDSSIMMIESDIRISSIGIPVAVHPPETESNLSYENLLERVKKSNKGLKLDFKDPEILIPCLQKLESIHLEQPVLLNADILQGNHANISKFSPSAFISLCSKYMSSAILSIGWTTVADSLYGYNQQNIDEMRKYSEHLKEVTFPVRACLLPNSWKYLSTLIQKEGHTLSIWNNEPIDKELRDWIKSNTDPGKTFYDFIDDNKDPLKLW